jgi:hypothetical protein
MQVLDDTGRVLMNMLVASVFFRSNTLKASSFIKKK